MINETLLDNSKGWMAFLAAVILLLLVNFIGYRLGLWHKKRLPETPNTSITDIMNAIFGLLGFTLAFVFSMSLTRMQHKRDMVQEEATAILNAYQKTQFLQEPLRTIAGKQIIDYAKLRYQLAINAREDRDINKLRTGIKLSEQIQDSLIHEGASNNIITGKNESSFIESVIQLVNLHVKRISRASVDRIPFTIKIIMYLMSFLGLGAIGYAAAIKGGRALIPNLILVLVFSVMIGMIIDMDSPANTFFHISQQPISDAINRMMSIRY